MASIGRSTGEAETRETKVSAVTVIFLGSRRAMWKKKDVELVSEVRVSPLVLRV